MSPPLVTSLFLAVAAAVAWLAASRARLVRDLRRSRDAFEVLVAGAPVGILQADAAGMCTFANRRWCEMTGCDEVETLGRAWSKAVHPDDLADTMAAWEASVRTGRRYVNALRLIHAHGHVIHVIATAAPLVDERGAVVGFMGTVLDITDTVNAERQLRGKDLQLRGIVDHAPAAVYLKDPEGRYLLVNRRFEEISGRPAAEIVGRDDNEVFPAATAREFMRADAEVWQSRSATSFEEPVVHADGQHTHLSVKFPVTDEAGAMVALGGISTDITEQRAVRDALEEERTLLRRLLELQEQERQRLCNEFHDGLIQGAVGAKMLLESCQHDAAAPLPRAAIDAVDAAIAALARGIEDGRRVIRGIRPALLDDLGLAAAVDELVGQLAPHGIRATSTVAADLGTLPEPLQITAYRIVQEALANCLRHSTAREVRVALERRGDDVLLEIADDGCGFDPTAARRRGFGLLGMEERARLAGGSCRVTSGADGTRVQVRLPLEAAEAAAAAG